MYIVITKNGKIFVINLAYEKTHFFKFKQRSCIFYVFFFFLFYPFIFDTCVYISFIDDLLFLIYTPPMVDLEKGVQNAGWVGMVWGL